MGTFHFLYVAGYFWNEQSSAIRFSFFNHSFLAAGYKRLDWFGNYWKIAGWEGIICGFTAIYLAMAQVLNEARGKTILPIGNIK